MVEKYARVVQGLSHHSRTIPIDTPLPTRLCLRALSRHFFPSETPHSHQFCLALAFLPYMGILSRYLGQDSKHMACILHFPTPKPRAGIAKRSQHSSSEPSQGLIILLHLVLQSATTGWSRSAGKISPNG